MRGSVFSDGIRPVRWEGVRLPKPTPQEEFGAPVTIIDAAGFPTIYSADEWRARNDTRCPHGYTHCYKCRWRLPSASGELRVSDAALLAAISAEA